MALITSSNRFMSIVRSYTIGSGVRHGSHGIALGTGVTGLPGGTYIVAGHTAGIGIIATHGIAIITDALSVPDIIRIRDTTPYTAV